MKPTIRTLQPDEDYFIEEQCFINEVSNSNDDPALSIARARVAPGVTTHWHRLRATVERYVILEGQGLVEIGDLPATRVEPGDVVLIPEMCRQRITNTGEQDLLFLALCTPRFRPENYEDMESGGFE